MEESPRQKLDIVGLAVSLFIPGFILNLGLWSIVPIVPIYAKSFGVSYGLASFVVTAAAIGKAITNVPSGMLVDRAGRRIPVLVSPLIIAVASTLAGLSANYAELVLWRFLEGVGLSLWDVGRNTIIVDEIPRQMRGRVISFYYAFFALGTAMGPVVGGYVAATFGIRATFFSYSIAAMVCFFGLLVSIKESRPKMGGAPAGLRKSLRSFSQLGPLKTTFIVATFGLMMNAVRNSANQTLIPLFGSFDLNLSVVSVGVALGVYGVAQTILQLPAGFVTDKLGRKKAIVPSQLVSGAALVAMTFANDYNTVLVLMLVSGVGAGLVGGSLRAIAGDMAPDESRGAFMGVWTTLSDVGTAIGPLILGFAADYVGLRLPFLGTGSALLVSALLIQFLSVETLTFESKVKDQT